jgi:hypothetical protein
MNAEMLTPNLFVAVNRRGPEIILREGQVRLLPERSNGLVVDRSSVRVHGVHVIGGFLLHRLACSAVVFVILVAETIRALHPSRLTVYNRGDVVPKEKCT